MKKLFTLLALFTSLALAPQLVRAQSGGAGSPPDVQCVCDLVTGDMSNGCYSTKNGLGNNPWSMSLVVDILRPAKDYFNLSLGQMIQEYHGCRCTITYLGENRFRVAVGGGADIVVVSVGI